jgi:hypothetical protein
MGRALPSDNIWNAPFRIDRAEARLAAEAYPKPVSGTPSTTRGDIDRHRSAMRSMQRCYSKATLPPGLKKSEARDVTRFRLPCSAYAPGGHSRIEKQINGPAG